MNNEPIRIVVHRKTLLPGLNKRLVKVSDEELNKGLHDLAQKEIARLSKEHEARVKRDQAERRITNFKPLEKIAYWRKVFEKTR